MLLQKQKFSFRKFANKKSGSHALGAKPAAKIKMAGNVTRPAFGMVGKEGCTLPYIGQTTVSGL